MNWLNSRRLRYLAGLTGLFFALFALLRAMFYFGFSGIGQEVDVSAATLAQAWSVGLRFDLRLALLLILPLALIAILPRWNLVSAPAWRSVARAYLSLAVVVVTLIYVFDFGYYAYLGIRINSAAFRFLEDFAISSSMVWQSYPVVWILLGWMAMLAGFLLLAFRLERATLDRAPTVISRAQRSVAGVAVALLIIFGLLGRVAGINPENPVPLRWSDAYASGNTTVAALGLNPVLFLIDTTALVDTPYDEALVRAHYAEIATYLGVDAPDADGLGFERRIGEQPHALVRPGQADGTPNVIFVMLESLGASRVGAYGNPLKPTPNLDRLAAGGWFFERFYVPVTGTAKTVWASLTSLPDVSKEGSATRNPLTTRQHLVLNAFEEHDKYYFIGGNAGWANMSALIRNSIHDIKLYEERDWKSPIVDVWGISDLDLFREADRILRARPAGQPFFAYIQTAGNHRPFTIPKDRDGFEPLDLTEEEVARWGFRSVAQFNAVRLLDFNIGRFMEMAEEGGYLQNTLFVFFGDHNNRITTLPHMAPAFEELNLESFHVPHIYYAPGLLEPRVIPDVVSLVDLLPSIAGIMGIEYTTAALGRDFQLPAPEADRAVFLLLREGSFPVLGAITADRLVQMEHDGSNVTFHDIESATPMTDIGDLEPDARDRLARLARGLYETSRLQAYRNRVE